MKKEDIMQKKMKALIAISLISSQTACSSLVGENLFLGEQQGRVAFSGDSEGIQSLFEGIAGIAQVGKDTPDQRGAYWLQREEQTKAKAIRWGYKVNGGAKK